VAAVALSGSACVSPFELESKRPSAPKDFFPHDMADGTKGLPAALALPYDSLPPVEDELAEYAAFVEQLLAE